MGRFQNASLKMSHGRLKRQTLMFSELEIFFSRSIISVRSVSSPSNTSRPSMKKQIFAKF